MKEIDKRTPDILYGADFWGEFAKFNPGKKIDKVIHYIKEVWKDSQDTVMIHFYGCDISASEFFDGVDAIAKSLKSLGVGKGDTIVTNLDAVPEFIMLFFACELIGANVKNKIGANASELVELINEFDAKCFFAHDYISSDDFEFIYNNTDLGFIVTVDSLAHLKGDYSSLTEANRNAINGLYANGKCNNDVCKNTSWVDFIQFGEGYNGEIDIKLEEDDDKTLFSGYTSGSTGKRKRIDHSSRAVLNMLDQMVFPSQDEVGSQIWWWPIYPPSFVAAVVAYMCLPLAQGQKIVLDPYLQPNDIAENFMQYRPNKTGLVPYLLNILMKNLPDEFDASFLNTLGLGAEQLSEKSLNKLVQWLYGHNVKPIISQGWGCSEACSNATIAMLDALLKGSAGIPLKNTKMCVVDPNTKMLLPFGSEGVLCIASESVMIGSSCEDSYIYINGEKWLYTGDYGKIEADGNVFVYGRDRIKTHNGGKVFPLVIENKVSKLDNIQRSIVVDKTLGNDETGYTLYVVVSEGENVLETYNRIFDELKTVLNDDEMPLDVVVFNSNFEVPTVSFKVDRKALHTFGTITKNSSEGVLTRKRKKN